MRSAPAGHRALLAALVVAAVATAWASPVRGAARIEGPIDALTIEARNATLAEVFAALSARFGVRIRAPQLLGQRVDGSFHGPLRWVLTRLFAGRNYIASYSDGAVEFIVFGPAASSPAAATDQPPPAAGPERPGRRTRNEAVSAAARAVPHTTGAAAGEANGTPDE